MPPGLVAFHSQLSPASVYRRFFSAKPTLTDDEVTRFTTVDYDDRVALVAELSGQLIGVARYERLAALHDAEVAFVVADEHQGRGIGTMLLEHLAAAARERGITRFVAETLADNRAMLSVFQDAGFDETSRSVDGVDMVELTIEPSG
jgi:GNAT superfamily N-acetyltransferase